MPTEQTSAEIDHATTWALADKIMSVSYGYAVAMHESIAAGRGAVGWQDFKQAAEITTVLGEFLLRFHAQAREAGRRERQECGLTIAAPLAGAVAVCDRRRGHEGRCVGTIERRSR